MMLTKDARAYRKLAADALWKVLGRRTDDPLMTVPVRLDVELRAPDRKARDLDNHLKAIQDVLTHYNVWGDDSQVDELTVRRGKVFSGGQAIIMITELT
jgi:crossover junction endodeoxyribonuclease RusA